MSTGKIIISIAITKPRLTTHQASQKKLKTTVIAETRIPAHLRESVISGTSSSHKSYSNVQYCAQVTQTNFVEICPLFSQLFYKKSSNFQKMFRRVLSEKIYDLPQKFERAEFAVATFGGNQTKMQDTVLCKSNANEIDRNLSFVLATFLRKVIEFSKDVSKGSKRKNHDLPRKFERAKFKVATF